MKLQFLIPALLGVLLLSGCVVEEPYATRGHYYHRGPAYYDDGPRYHDTVIVENRSYPRYGNYDDRSYSRGYARSDYRSSDHGNYDRSYSHGGYERAHSNNQIVVARGSQNYQRSNQRATVAIKSTAPVPQRGAGQQQGHKKHDQD